MYQRLNAYDENPKIIKMARQVKWKILEAVTLLTFFFNVENLASISKMEMKKMEQLHKS